jgi:plastocyanin
MRHALPVLTLMLVSCAPEPGDERPSAGESVKVTLTCENNHPEAPCEFRPAHVQVRAGGSVRWVNADGTFHTVTSSDSLKVRRPNGVFDAVLDSKGEQFSHTFTEPGRFAYYCQPHAEFMAGTVTVAG